MPTACILQPDSSIHLTSQRLEIWGRNPASGAEEILREIPIRDVERLIFAESVQITSAALAALLRANIPVNLLGWSGQFLGAFLPATNTHGLARLRQYQHTLDRGFALQMAGRIVTAKLYNQRRVLQRLAASREDTRNPGDSSGGDSPLPVGEGQGEGIIQNPKSKIQNSLDWLDALFASISRSQSLDELRGYEGAATARYFQAWAAFLPEEFPFERRSTRPPLNPVNACNDDGRKKFILQYERRMERQFMSECAGHRTTLRQQLEQQAVMYKAALEQQEKFEPFLMN